MSTISKALCWAGALILLAIGNAAGLVADDVAGTLFIVLPVLAITTIRGQACCAGRTAA